jgi:hypothetical protein
MDLLPMFEEFAIKIATGDIEIYNEASIQYELAILLREKLVNTYKVQLERNIEHFGLNKTRFLKREMDIVVLTPDNNEKHCIELKYPTQGQYPEQMFSACKDVKFLEQLIISGFDTSYFMMFAQDQPFYTNKGDYGIYLKFRKQKVIEGEIRKPTGKKDQVLSFNGTHAIDWKTIKNNLKYFVVPVKS